MTFFWTQLAELYKLEIFSTGSQRTPTPVACQSSGRALPLGGLGRAFTILRHGHGHFHHFKPLLRGRSLSLPLGHFHHLKPNPTGTFTKFTPRAAAMRQRLPSTRPRRACATGSGTRRPRRRSFPTTRCASARMHIPFGTYAACWGQLRGRDRATRRISADSSGYL